MDKETITYYKLILAHDLITYMMKLYLNSVPVEQKAKAANMILESWEKRVSVQLEESMKHTIKAVADDQGVDEDVQAILASIHRIEPELVRKEFKVESRHQIFRSFMEKNSN